MLPLGPDRRGAWHAQPVALTAEHLQISGREIWDLRDSRILLGRLDHACEVRTISLQRASSATQRFRFEHVQSTAALVDERARSRQLASHNSQVTQRLNAYATLVYALTEEGGRLRTLAEISQNITRLT